VFVDTGAFLAKETAADQHDAAANAGWAKAEASVLFSSGHILDESATLLSRRHNYALAAGSGEDALECGIHWLQTEPLDWPSALDLLRKYADQSVSFRPGLMKPLAGLTHRNPCSQGSFAHWPWGRATYATSHNLTSQTQEDFCPAAKSRKARFLHLHVWAGAKGDGDGAKGANLRWRIGRSGEAR